MYIYMYIAILFRRDAAVKGDIPSETSALIVQLRIYSYSIQLYLYFLAFSVRTYITSNKQNTATINIIHSYIKLYLRIAKWSGSLISLQYIAMPISLFNILYTQLVAMRCYSKPAGFMRAAVSLLCTYGELYSYMDGYVASCGRRRIARSRPLQLNNKAVYIQNALQTSSPAMEGIRKCIELNMRYYISVTSSCNKERKVKDFVPLCFVARKRNGNFFCPLLQWSLSTNSP